MHEDRAGILADVCLAMDAGGASDAAAILRERYPFAPSAKAGRSYSPSQCLDVFVRDGFVDRYSGSKLVFPGTIRILSHLLGADFPFHPNWKTDACHQAYWDLLPTIDHVVPVTRGGRDEFANWVSTSMVRNASGDIVAWDGLTGWFLSRTAAYPDLLVDPYLQRWRLAAERHPELELERLISANCCR